MSIQQVHSFARGAWQEPGPNARPVPSAIDGRTVALVGDHGLDMADMLAYARDVGGPALRRLGFHDRARMLKALAAYLNDHKSGLYDLSYDTGATRRDHAFDIDGGIGTLFVYASKGRRELPDGQVYIDGGIERLSREGSFLGQHICVPRHGVAVQINAFNFPVWGMLEKLAPALLAGMPSIVKPATSSAYVTEACVRLIAQSGLLPDGAIQLVSGHVGDMLDHLGPQDSLGFTGSAQTASLLRAHPGVLTSGVRFTAEQDSLNATVLGPDIAPGTPAFDLFRKEVLRELTTKAGQKCTAIRRILVPHALQSAVAEKLSEALAQVVIGDPRDKATGMGALISLDQRDDVRARVALLREDADILFGQTDSVTAVGVDTARGAFQSPVLLHCDDPDAARHVHEVEAFGPVATLMPYRDVDHAADLLRRGGGSLVASAVTGDADVARQITLATAAWHGRLYFNNTTSAAESTGHGAPMPHMLHGGPGRAGGGEELGGIRGVLHHMQRTAVQGTPDILSAITGQWVPGSQVDTAQAHPFTRGFDTLRIGEQITTQPRRISLDDIEHFAEFTGDTFYAHMDEEAAAANPFFPGRVAHGYLLLSFAAGLFVQPDPGPVLANTGLDNLRFLQPVSPGDAIHVCLTVKAKTRRTDSYGEVRWHVVLRNQDNVPVAEYELLTMNSYAG